MKCLISDVKIIMHLFNSKGNNKNGFGYQYRKIKNN